VKKLPEPGEYLEKTAILKTVGTGLGLFGNKILEGAKALWGSPWGKAAVIGVPAAGLAWHGLGLGGISEGKQQGNTLSYRINRGLNTLFDRIQADEVAAKAFSTQLGKDTSSELFGLTRDIVTKGYETLKDKLQTSPVRHAIFESLKAEDPVLAEADNQTLLEAYHTMARVAPTLATDKNAVRSFLIHAVVSGGGLDFNTIKGIADAEAAVNRARSGGGDR
jgi:hypothetical protein